MASPMIVRPSSLFRVTESGRSDAPERFRSILDEPGFLHAVSSEEDGTVHVYASTAVDLQNDDIAAPLRNYLAGGCCAVLDYGEYREPMFWDGRGRSMTLVMLDECPGENVPHVCSVLLSGARPA